MEFSFSWFLFFFEQQNREIICHPTNSRNSIYVWQTFGKITNSELSSTRNNILVIWLKAVRSYTDRSGSSKEFQQQLGSTIDLEDSTDLVGSWLVLDSWKTIFDIYWCIRQVFVHRSTLFFFCPPIFSFISTFHGILLWTFFVPRRLTIVRSSSCNFSLFISLATIKRRYQDLPGKIIKTFLLRITLIKDMKEDELGIFLI